MRIPTLCVALAATSLVAACGGGSEPNADREAKARQSLLDFARCMREHGVDMADPQFDGGRVTMRQSGGVDGDPETLRAAEQACAKYREAVQPPETSDEEREEFKQQALAHARCMREHGIDMPDPTFDERGAARVKIGKGSGVDPDSAKFKQAQEACASTQPGGGPATTDVDQ